MKDGGWKSAACQEARASTKGTLVCVHAITVRVDGMPLRLNERIENRQVVLQRPQGTQSASRPSSKRGGKHGSGGRSCADAKASLQTNAGPERRCRTHTYRARVRVQAAVEHGDGVAKGHDAQGHRMPNAQPNHLRGEKKRKRKERNKARTSIVVTRLPTRRRSPKRSAGRRNIQQQHTHTHDAWRVLGEDPRRGAQGRKKEVFK